MTIIVQPKRWLLTDFRSDRALQNFIKFNTVTKTDMFFQATSAWTALYETDYNGVPALAVPRRFNTEILNRFVDIDNEEVIKDMTFWKESPRKINVESVPRDEEQKRMLDFLLGRGKYEKLSSTSRRALFASTGTGKTFLTLKAVSEKNLFTFINCPDKKALLTWQQEIEKFTDITADEVGIMQGSDSLPKLLKSKEKYKIILGSSKTFSALIANNEYGTITEFFEKMGFGLLVHDEVHLNLMVVFFLEMMTRTRNTFYLTATIGRRMYKESKILEALMPPESATYVQAVKPRIEFFRCIFYSNPKEKSHTKGLQLPGGFNYIRHGKEYLLNEKYPYREPFLNEHLARVVKAARGALTNKSNKIAILSRTKEENTVIMESLTARYGNKLSIGLFNSDIVDMDERFKETDCQLIISTDKSFAGIINIPNLEAIIITSPISAEQHLLQIVGRIRKQEGKRTLVYMLADASFGSCYRALGYAKSAISDHCVSIEDVHLNQSTKFSTPFDD